MASPSPSGGINGADSPWVEKYRPIYFKQIVGNHAAATSLRNLARNRDFPNFILSGPPGTGKSSSFIALAYHIFGQKAKELVLELNASTDRKTESVMNEIEMFAQKKVKLATGRYKLVILNYFDRLKHGAQQTLGDTMERYSNSIRFALTCNTDKDTDDVDIIEPIKSRCALVRFSRLSDELIRSRLMMVMTEEKVPYASEGLEAVISAADGSMREALETLQATFSRFHFVNQENVFKAHPRLLFGETKNETCSVIGSKSGDAFLASQNGPSNGAEEVEKRSSLKREGERCENSRDKRLCVCNETANLATENEELQNMVRDWKARFADVEIKRKEAKKQLKLVEEEKAELLRKVAELEKAMAKQPLALS